MNKVVIFEENSKGLEASLEGLEGQFTPEEILVVQSILFAKAIHGATARLWVPRERLYEDGNEEMGNYILGTQGVLNQLATKTEGLAREYASRLGISGTRFSEIEEYVYRHEQTL